MSWLVHFSFSRFAEEGQPARWRTLLDSANPTAPVPLLQGPLTPLSVAPSTCLAAAPPLVGQNMVPSAAAGNQLFLPPPPAGLARPGLPVLLRPQHSGDHEAAGLANGGLAAARTSAQTTTPTIDKLSCSSLM